MNTNTQFVRTDKAIQSALVALLSRKPFEKITVQDILEETPVSRATFYKHYHDKYEIVEKMQTEFLQVQKDIVSRLAEAKPAQTPSMIQSYSARYREIMQILMKVQTDKVNLPMALVEEAERQYLKTSNSPTKNLEARVYGAALTSFQIAFLEERVEDYTVHTAPRVFGAVMLKLIGLQDDPDIWKLINQKL